MSAQLKVTDRQFYLLSEIQKFIADKRYPPAHRELCEVLGVTSTNSVVCLLEQLVNKGLISVTPHVARGLSITDSGARLLQERAS